MSRMYSRLWRAPRALVILKVIADLGRPARLVELVAVTGGDDETLSKYCSLLAKMGLLTRVSGHAGWALTRDGLAFIQPGVPPAAPSPQPDQAAALAENPVNSPDSELSFSTNLTHHRGSRAIKSPEIGDSSGNRGDWEQNWQLFEQIGVLHNQRSEQLAAQLPNRLVLQEWHKLQALGKPWPGLLIKILTEILRKHPASCCCEACARKLRQRYGAYDQERITPLPSRPKPGKK